MSRTRRHSARRERGAALIVAIGVLTLLLVIALTFFRASLGDMKTAENTVNGVRAELLADGATAVAIAFLNHDRLVRPTASSLDHAWRTYFNGTWAVGKPWLWAPIADPSLGESHPNYIHATSLLRGGVPEINQFAVAAFPDLQLAGAPRDAMYIPRVDFEVGAFNVLSPEIGPLDYRTFDPNDPTVLQNPFVTTSDLADPAAPAKFPSIDWMYGNLDTAAVGVIFPADFAALTTNVFDVVAPEGRALSLAQTTTDDSDLTLPSEQIHFWNDVDNDGDGLNDSMWLPVGTDRYFPEDGLDNDLDGRLDALGADGVENSGDEDTDGEPGVFMYRGDTDGLDNNGGGDIDEAGEELYVIFTVPYPFLADLDADGAVDIVAPSQAEYAAMGIDINVNTVLYEGARDNNTGLPTGPIGFVQGNRPLYTRDNDYDLVADQPMDASRYMLSAEAVQALVDVVVLGQGTAYPYVELLRALVGDDNIQAYANAPFDPTRASLQMAGTIRGETVTELSGRMAILIVDESSKVNLNIAGATSFDIAKETANATVPLTRSFNLGVGPHEYETRVVPFQSGSSWGTGTATRASDLRLGAPQGLGLSMDDTSPIATYVPPIDTAQLTLDMSLPGYGRVDDNANLLELVFKGSDMDGDTVTAQSTNSALPDLLGFDFEGIDEPAEYQRFRPYRDITAETNGVDDDDDGVTDEIGEFGDTYYRTHQQIKNLDSLVGIGRYEWMRRYITAHSADRNDRHFYQDTVLGNFTQSVLRQTTGLRKDLNIARPQFVANAVRRDWSYPLSLAQQYAVTGFLAEGGVLSGSGFTLTDTDLGAYNPAFGSTVDFLLGLRQENVSVVSSEPILGRYDTTGEDTAFALLADSELRAHQVAATLKDFADRDFTRSVDDEIFTEDYWWQSLADRAAAANPADVVLQDAAEIAGTRRIRYTVAGLEAIRINEVNVRPVRRFEAEAITDLDAGESDALDFRGLDPNRFVPHDNYPPEDTIAPIDAAGHQLAAEAIEEEGFRVRVTTTTDAIEAYNLRRSDNVDVLVDSSFSNDLDPNPDADPEGERWNPRPQFTRSGAIQDAGLLGLEAAWATYRQYLDVFDPDAVDPNRTFEVPDVVQFSFQATDGLPAGRYYLKLNTQYVRVTLDPLTGNEVRDLVDTIDETSDFLFAVKIGTLEQDWFADVMNIEAYVESNTVYNEAWRNPALLGSDVLGGSAGMAFLQGDSVFRSNLAPGVDPFALTRDEFLENNTTDDTGDGIGDGNNEPNLGFTIEVPERVFSIPPVLPDTIEDDLWVHIAIRSMLPDDTGFVVNYLEFSQEPDHEWVEVTNESDEAVDLSGWQLAVENHPLGFGPMTVPDGTLIAPKGMLLLGTNKFDYANNITFDPITGDPAPVIAGDTSDPADPDMFDRGVGFFGNGIGLVNSRLAALINSPAVPNLVPFETISVPQIFYDELGITVQGSVFEGFIPDRTANPIAPSAFVDYMDRDGDGEYDAAADRIEEDVQTESTETGTSYSAPAVLDMPQDLPIDPLYDALAVRIKKPWDRIVELIVPDLVAQAPQTQFAAADVGRIVLGGGIFPNRPEFDAWDNDGDNAVIGFDGIDNDADGDDVDEVDEGLDEGRFAREQRLRNGVTQVPGSFSAEIARYQSFFFDIDMDPDNGAAIRPGYWTGDRGLPDTPVTQDSPPWKEFIERRNFPGENVIVTLYEGPASDAQPADRVTYTQRDVENRQIDDVVMVNDFDVLNGEAWPFADDTLIDALSGDRTLGVPLPLDDRFSTFWPENTMDVDFARSLERKHPSYTGDRFGTQNRFQATDGNYDDWSDSTGRWERFDNTPPTSAPLNLIDRRNVPAFSHAFGGTPLRRNVPARYVDLGNRGDAFELTEFSNRPLVSPGSALLTPYTSRTSVLATNIASDPNSTEETYFLIDRASTNASTGGGVDETYDSALLGQRFDDALAPIDFFRDIRSFIGDVGTTDSVSLNVGQAQVIQVTRVGGGPIINPVEIAWDQDAGQLTGNPPQRWSPLMMFSLSDDASAEVTPPPFGFQEYSYEMQYLFQPLGSLPATIDKQRWPRELRTAVYVTRNFDDFGTPDTAVAGDGAQAVFVWDGDDGLENGEYDLYVVATEDLSVLAQAHATVAGGLLTDTDTGLPIGDQGVGLPFVSATQRTANREVYFDIEVFRDSNGDRKAWAPDLLPNELLADAQLNRGPAPAESFGLLEGARPDADGVIHYGIVKVENNFLAVSLRNRSAAGTVARISRVMLAARNKTPGRININTAETKRIGTTNDPGAFYNPLTGLPGIVGRTSDDSSGSFNGDSAGFDLFDDEDNSIPADSRTEILARHIAEQRLRLIGEQPDGRYYEVTSDLLSDAHLALLDHPLTTEPSARLPLVAEYSNYLSVANPGDTRPGAIAEAAYRFRRMQNLITTRGNAYEILVTVQAGYGSDANGDGRINWRDDAEFTATAEKTARTVYER